jgi:glycosyltransferase involved in cell wall biosynthesis
MRVSIVTPTFGRPEVLPHLYHAFLSQDHPHCELLIADDSPQPCEAMQRIAAHDPRVRYFHTPARETIGAKRNFLIEQARGEVIVHFDDDDYYAPNYVSSMLRVLGAHDAAKLSAWFNYSPRLSVLAYWDCQSEVKFGYSMAPQGALDLVNNAAHPGNTWGFGFSYIYRRRVWEAVRFDNRSFGEDYDFLTRAFQAGFTGKLHADTAGIVLHIIHTSNTSRAFPQYLLPAFMLSSIFGADLQKYAQASPFTLLNLAS